MLSICAGGRQRRLTVSDLAPDPSDRRRAGGVGDFGTRCKSIAPFPENPRGDGPAQVSRAPRHGAQRAVVQDLLGCQLPTSPTGALASAHYSIGHCVRCGGSDRHSRGHRRVRPNLGTLGLCRRGRLSAGPAAEHASRTANSARSMPQFFISELHVERFSAGFAAPPRVRHQPRSACAPRRAALHAFAEHGSCELGAAAAGLREILAAFGRCHNTPTLVDYQVLLAESAEAADRDRGCAFNHTAACPDVDAVACEQRDWAVPSGQHRVSRSGSVRQTAFSRPCRPHLWHRRRNDGPDGARSFYEFIS